jgi:hypothetical protein
MISPPRGAGTRKTARRPRGRQTLPLPSTKRASGRGGLPPGQALMLLRARAGQCATAATAPEIRPAVPLALGILSPRKITVKAARSARALRVTLRASLDSDLPRQEIGAYQEDGETVDAFAPGVSDSTLT